MSRLPHKPIRLLSDLERRVDEAFSALIHGPWNASSLGNWEPAIDLSEGKDEYLVVIDLPGVTPEEVKVTVEGQVLIVHGRRTSQQWTQTGATIYAERFEGEFVRRIPLPDAVDHSRVETQFAQGLLFIRLPKRRSGIERRTATEDAS